MHAAGGDLESEAAATGVYFGCMYTEYLDAILGPSVSSKTCSPTQLAFEHGYTSLV